LAGETKEQQIKELHDKFSRAKAAVFADYKGLTVQELTDLRKMLRGAGIEFKVVKNTLAIIASKGTPFESTAKYFTGQTSLAISYKDPVAPAKIMVSYAKKEEKLNIKAGLVEGNAIEVGEVKKLSELPSREVLLSKALASMMSPATNLVGVLHGVVRKFVYTLKAIEEAKTKK
jgi:large subunit ribosomal protein L10